MANFEYAKNWFSGDVSNKMIMDERFIRSITFISEAETVEVDGSKGAANLHSQIVSVLTKIRDDKENQIYYG